MQCDPWQLFIAWHVLFSDGMWVSVYQQAGGDVQGYISLKLNHGQVQGAATNKFCE